MKTKEFAEALFIQKHSLLASFLQMKIMSSLDMKY